MSCRVLFECQNFRLHWLANKLIILDVIYFERRTDQ